MHDFRCNDIIVPKYKWRRIIMQIIKGMHLNKKLNELANHLPGPAYIITENTEYVEDLFLNKYSC